MDRRGTLRAILANPALWTNHVTGSPHISRRSRDSHMVFDWLRRLVASSMVHRTAKRSIGTAERCPRASKWGHAEKKAEWSLLLKGTGDVWRGISSAEKIFRLGCRRTPPMSSLLIHGFVGLVFASTTAEISVQPLRKLCRTSSRYMKAELVRWGVPPLTLFIYIFIYIVILQPSTEIHIWSDIILKHRRKKHERTKCGAIKYSLSAVISWQLRKASL